MRKQERKSARQLKGKRKWGGTEGKEVRGGIGIGKESK